MLGLYLAGRRVFRIRVVAAAAAESVLFTAVIAFPALMIIAYDGS